jgi:hypothetical protein
MNVAALLVNVINEEWMHECPVRAATMTILLIEHDQLMSKISGHIITMDDSLSTLNLAHRNSLVAIPSLPVGHNERMDLVGDHSDRGHPAALERGEDEQPGRNQASLALAYRSRLLHEHRGLAHLHVCC